MGLICVERVFLFEMKQDKILYVISGCNGAGKTTASYTILPEILNCKEFVNADEIAKGLSPFQPDLVSIQAGKIMLNRIDSLIELGQTFAFETTLSTRSHESRIRKAKELGYQVVLLFFWLQSVDLAIDRVKNRSREGGHFIEEDVIRRRYKKGIYNLFELFIPVVDLCYIIDNSGGVPQIIAERNLNGEIIIIENGKFELLKSVIC